MPLTKVWSMDQWVFDDVDELAGLLDNLQYNFSLEDLIAYIKLLLINCNLSYSVRDFPLVIYCSNILFFSVFF